MPTEAEKTPTGAAVDVCYLYGIVRDGLRPNVERLGGVGDAPITFVREGELAAVVADVSSAAFTETPDRAGDVAWLEAAVRAHERVLDECLSNGPVLPMRFATTFRTEDDVRNLLRERKAEFGSELDRFQERLEWGVKALVDPAALSVWARNERADLAEKERELSGTPPGAAYFAQKRLQQELKADGEDAVVSCVRTGHERLSSVADDSRVLPLPPKGQHVHLNAAYLVGAHRNEEFQAMLAALGNAQAALGIRYELSGPWPPYNFVSDGERA